MFILARNSRFQWLAAAMEQLGFSLQDVLSCTFPSRPEPKSARWLSPSGQEWLRYVYLPDLEVRYLVQTSTSEDAGLAAHFNLEQVLEEMLGEPPFERWSTLRDDLREGNWSDAQRAATAWRIRAQHALDEQDRDLCARMLEEALEVGSISTKRAITEQLCHFSHASLRSALERAREDDDLEVRLHARKALERLDARSLIF